MSNEDIYGVQATEDLLSKEVKSKNSKDSKDSKEIRLYGRGGIVLQHELVYEPIGDFYYLYNINGKKGIAQAKPKPKTKGKQFYIDIAGNTYDFADKPLRDLLFPVPDHEDIKSWIKGVYPETTGEDIFNKVKSYFKTVLDLAEEHHYLNPTLGALQSWIEDALEVVFYIAFEAKYGSGKTKGLEAIAPAMRRGFLAGDPSSATVGRMVEKLGVNLCVDELDTMSGSKDNVTYKLFRQGYRKGNPYVRVNENDLTKFDIFDGFGTKSYTFVEDIEPALKQRTLITPMRPTDDKRLPIIDMHIRHYGKEIRTKLFFWYMGSIVELLPSLRSLPYLPSFSGGTDIDTVRTELYEQITKEFTEEEKQFLEKWAGRNLELAYNIPLIQKAYGVDILEEVVNTFEEKEEEDKASSDNLLIEELKGLLVDLYDEQSHNYRLEKGEFKECFYYPKNEVLRKYRARLKDKGYWIVGNDKFKRYLKELNFQKGKNKGNMCRQYWEGRNLLCLVYDDKVLSELRISQDKLHFREEAEEVIVDE